MAAPAEISDWLPVDGIAAAKILPLIRQADALCSNSYVISTGSALLVIDPGAHEEQTDRIRRVLSEELAAQQRPVLFLLTHCHHDHSRSLEFWSRQQEIPVSMLAHEAGAAAIKSGDSDLTLSYIFSQDFPSISIDFPIPFTSDSHMPVAEGIVLSGTDTQGGFSAKRRLLRLDEGLSLELYHTPGHSPDSLCFRLGPLLFTGDVLLADKPGVAGIPGWSQPQLLETLRFLEWLLSRGIIAACCPGHGALLNAPDVLGMLQAARKNAQRLSRLICLDDQRLDFLKTCAVVLAREAALQLAVLGGRLHLAARLLDELGEEKLAQELVRDIDLDGMETFLVQFQDFSDMHVKDLFRSAIPLHGVHMIGRIVSLLTKARLPEGIAAASVRRIELLLRDYLNIVSGLDLRDFLAPSDAVTLLQNALKAFDPPEISEAEIDVAADSSELFGLFLARRLYLLPEISGIVFRPSGMPLPPVITEPERLTQLFTDCIEQFACAAGNAEISVRQKNDCVAVCLSRQAGDASLNSRKIRYYEYMMELLGGAFTHQLINDVEQACFRMPI